jgi:hypothetical protein
MNFYAAGTGPLVQFTKPYIRVHQQIHYCPAGHASGCNEPFHMFTSAWDNGFGPCASTYALSLCRKADWMGAYISRPCNPEHSETESIQLLCLECCQVWKQGNVEGHPDFIKRIEKRLAMEFEEQKQEEAKS